MVQRLAAPAVPTILSFPVASVHVTSKCDLRACVGSARRGINKVRGGVVVSLLAAPSVQAVKAL